ncbi:MAG: hypothetical protein GY811_18255 [Myxococcales bacterium]|nr:hypothetical protein [Myxococcales bacterium]
MVDTSSIHRVIGTARRRLKMQAAMEWATLASIATSAIVMGVVVAARLGWVAEGNALVAIISAACLIPLAALLGASRPFTDNFVATKIDRSSELSDRLASACAFENKLRNAKSDSVDADTKVMMHLAMLDAAKHVEKARPKLATPFRRPREGRAALAFAAVAILVSGIRIDRDVPKPALAQLVPAAAIGGSVVTATGNRLLTPAGPRDTVVFVGEGETALTAKVLSVTTKRVEFEIPPQAPVGMTTITVRAGAYKTQARPFEILDEEDPRAIPEENVVLEDEDVEFVRDLVAELRKTSEANEDLALEELANKLDKLLDQAEKGQVNKKQILEALSKAEEKYMEGSKEAVEESVSDLKKAGKELKKDKLTKDLGKALETGDLEQAKAEMEKLAKKLEDNKPTEKQEQQLGKAMEKAAEKMAKAEEKRDAKMQKHISKKQESIRKLEKKREESRTEEEKEETVRRLEKEKRELRRLQRKQEEKQKDASKRELKQLHRKMSEAAKQLQKKQQKQQQRQRSRREVSKTMRDMARRTGKVSQDKRKMANKPKVVTQMSDLKEALRRAKRKGKKGPKNRFGRNGKRKKDFGSRARGGKGQKGAWKPGQGQGGKKPGQGQGQAQGQGGKKPGGKEYGDSHDPDSLMGDSTKTTGNTKDENLQGVRGKGPSTRETILTAAQKGFASRSYEDVFVHYKAVLEEVIKAEKVPSGYKHYVQRYYHQIRPTK